MKQLVLAETIAIGRGHSRVDQCAQCGALVCHDVGRNLGACPACGGETWWKQTIPSRTLSEEETLRLPGHISGPFYVAETGS